MPKQTKTTSGTGSSRKVLKLLMSFDERRSSATADELARSAEVPLSTAYRYISLLREVGLLEEGKANTFVVSPKILPLARAALAAHPLLDLATPVLKDITESCGETSLLLRRVSQSAVCVARWESSHPVRLSFDVGRPMPLHRGAAAKVLLSSLPEDERALYYRTLSRDELGDRDGLEAEIRSIRENGWTVSHGEVDQGIWAAAAAVTDGREVIAALTAAGLAHNIDERRRSQILAAVKEGAATISRHATALRV